MNVSRVPLFDSKEEKKERNYCQIMFDRRSSCFRAIGAYLARKREAGNVR